MKSIREDVVRKIVRRETHEMKSEDSLNSLKRALEEVSRPTGGRGSTQNRSERRTEDGNREAPPKYRSSVRRPKEPVPGGTRDPTNSVPRAKRKEKVRVHVYSFPLSRTETRVRCRSLGREKSKVCPVANEKKRPPLAASTCFSLDSPSFCRILVPVRLVSNSVEYRFVRLTHIILLRSIDRSTEQHPNSNANNNASFPSLPRSRILRTWTYMINAKKERKPSF